MCRIVKESGFRFSGCGFACRRPARGFSARRSAFPVSGGKGTNHGVKAAFQKKTEIPAGRIFPSRRVFP
jgi:hypothetical protein